MAVAAETNTIYQFVDDIPELATAREQERLAAHTLLDSRRAQWQANPESTQVPLPIDALSTARSVLKVADEYGRISSEYIERREGLALDCQRLVAEWYRKKKPEYFPAVRHTFDAKTEEFFSHGLSIRQMTENAITPFVDDPEEEHRRLNERVEDATPQLVRGLGITAVAIRTISECTDKAISDYEFDMKHGHKHGGYRGYVPEIQKVMIRDIRPDLNTNDRFEEQIGLPGTYITHEIIQMALGHAGVDASQKGKTELHGSQLLVADDLLEFAELLDTVASQEWCVNIFMGEVVPDGFVKDYTNFRSEALHRQASLKDIADSVANFVLCLAEDEIDGLEAPAMVEEFVKLQLLELAKGDYRVAEQMFDTATATGLQEVAYLESIGQYEQAFERMGQVEQAAPGGGFCGAGSCGIVGVSELSAEAGKARELGLGKGLMFDTIRKCPNCNTRKVYYDSKANKACLGCTKTVINGKSKSQTSSVLAA